MEVIIRLFKIHTDRRALALAARFDNSASRAGPGGHESPRGAPLVCKYRTDIRLSIWLLCLSICKREWSAALLRKTHVQSAKKLLIFISTKRALIVLIGAGYVYTDRPMPHRSSRDRLNVLECIIHILSPFGFSTIWAQRPSQSA